MSFASAANSQANHTGVEPIQVALFGRCLLPNTLEIPCQVVNISLNALDVVAGHLPQVNEKIIMYLDHVGRLEGAVETVFDGGFGLKIVGTERFKEKLGERIEWLKTNSDLTEEDGRRHERISPRDSNSEIKLTDGRTYPAQIVDISLSGAAIRVEVKPALGSHLTLAGMQGQVVRHFEEGIAIEFAKVVPIKRLERGL